MMCLSSLRLFFSDSSCLQLTQASSNIIETGSPNLTIRHDSAFSLAWSSCFCCLSDMPRDGLTLLPPAVVKLAYHIPPTEDRHGDFSSCASPALTATVCNGLLRAAIHDLASLHQANTETITAAQLADLLQRV